MPDISECIKIVDRLVSETSYEHEREAWQTLKTAVLAQQTTNKQSAPSTYISEGVVFCAACGTAVDVSSDRVGNPVDSAHL